MKIPEYSSEWHQEILEYDSLDGKLKEKFLEENNISHGKIDEYIPIEVFLNYVIMSSEDKEFIESAKIYKEWKSKNSSKILINYIEDENFPLIAWDTMYDFSRWYILKSGINILLISKFILANEASIKIISGDIPLTKSEYLVNFLKNLGVT